MPYSVGEREIVITASIGISVYPLDGDTYEDLVKGADTAMYQSKAAGRNTFQYYTRSLRDRTSERLALMEDLAGAIESGTELRIEYQSKVDLARGAVIGLEALVKWDHPKRGLLLPGDFLALAEESELIIPMSKWLFDEACLDMRRWLGAGMRPMRVAVNVSGRLFRHGNLVESIAVALAAADLDPRHLEIEVTERTERVLERIADMGVRVSIDDFGVGYSSLRQLQRLSVRTQGDGASVLTVSDAGQGFTDLGGITRGAGGTDSTGLGLDIVVRTAERFGGGVRIGTSTDGGREISVVFGAVGLDADG